jgi:malonyl-CoA O-methyltransferase
MKRAHHGDIAHFDRWAASYDRTPGHSLFARVHRPVVDAVCTGIGPQRVVDVGCGTGRLLEALLARLPGAELVGVDPAEGMISVARSRFAGEPRIRFEVATADHLPLDDGCADVVTTTLSFHHWERQEASLREVARVLGPAGRLLIADIFGIGFVGRLLRPTAGRHGVGYRNAAELAGLLRDAGFSAWRRRSLFGPVVPVFLVEARRPQR